MTPGDGPFGASHEQRAPPTGAVGEAPDAGPAANGRAAPPRPRRRLRLTPPAHALVPGGASGTRASVVVALGFVAMLASSPGQTYWLSLFVDDMIAGTGLGRTGFSMVYAGATVFSAAVVLVVGAAYDRRGPALTWALVALALAAGSLLMSVAAGALVALVALGMLRAFGQGSFPLLGTLLVARTFESWRGRAIAVAHLGSTFAAAVLPPVAAGLLAAFGWRRACRSPPRSCSSRSRPSRSSCAGRCRSHLRGLGRAGALRRRRACLRGRGGFRGAPAAARC